MAAVEFPHPSPGVQHPVGDRPVRFKPQNSLLSKNNAFDPHLISRDSKSQASIALGFRSVWSRFTGNGVSHRIHKPGKRIQGVSHGL